MQFIIVEGNPIGGFEIYGPFRTEEEAHVCAGLTLGEDDWAIAPLATGYLGCSEGHVVVDGTFVDGFTFTGPFPGMTQAQVFILTREGEPTGCIAELIAPTK